MKKIFSLMAGSLLLLSSCNDWLDVNPKTNIKEDELFSTEQGFKEALTGVYMGMSETSLYGRELTYGFIDILAQRYSTGSDSQTLDYTLPAWYQFPSNHTETYTNKFWSGHYNLIANLNNLLTNIDNRGDVITTEGYRDIIAGEALALRSFLYFDLLRMFGPIYKDNPQSPSIPYRTKFDRATAKLLPATQVVDSIIASLREAERLLANDPMNISFPTMADNDDDVIVDEFLNYRFNRMNKYAVKAELARVYLYKGDDASKQLAANYAQEVIDARKDNKQIFTLVSDCSTDHVCSTELIFSLSMDSETFDTQVEGDFQIGDAYAYFIKDRNRVNSLFDVMVDGYNDMRMKEGQGFTLSTNGSRTLKYKQEGLFSVAVENQMPLIRLPEMYYIVAECSNDLDEAAAALSVVRSTRGLSSIDTFADHNERMIAVEKEYRKEFYAEGQLWYFYKRNGYKTFQFCPINDLKESNYRFSIPDDESSLGNIY